MDFHNMVVKLLDAFEWRMNKEVIITYLKSLEQMDILFINNFLHRYVRPMDDNKRLFVYQKLMLYFVNINEVGMLIKMLGLESRIVEICVQILHDLFSLDVVRKVLQTVGDREKNYDQMVNILFLIGSRESTCHAFNLLAIDMRVGASNIVQIALEHHALENLLLWMLYEDQVIGRALFFLMEMIRGCEPIPKYNAEYILSNIKSVTPV
jgi:hypothetical protein